MRPPAAAAGPVSLDVVHAGEGTSAAPGELHVALYGPPSASSPSPSSGAATASLRAPGFGFGRKAFLFDRVLGPSTTHEHVYADIAPLVRSALDGYNACVFAYGQTGSGKVRPPLLLRVTTCCRHGRLRFALLLQACQGPLGQRGPSLS